MKPAAIFYSPMKSADASLPSGVSQVASLFVRAMEGAGFQVEAPDLPPAYEGRGDSHVQRNLRDRAAYAAHGYVEALRERAVRPALWLTYHCYYKSPDMIGPIVAKALGCAYAIAEGSYARKRENGPWAEHHEAAKRALAAADILLAVTERDREGLALAAGRAARVVAFPPFVDCEPFLRSRRSSDTATVRILAAGSMRDERKHQSYRRLLSSLSGLPPGSYALTIAGDGPLRLAIEAEARALRVNAIFLGQLQPNAMPEFFAQGDLLAWPGVGEAYGLTYLEAQASGVPVVAEIHGGVAACVRDGVSGLLTDPNDPGAYARALNTLIVDEMHRKSLGASARDWVTRERSLPAASARLRATLARVLS